MSRFSVESFFSHNVEKHRRATFKVSLISGIKKFYASEGFVTISVEIFRLTVPKNFVGEPLLH